MAHKPLTFTLVKVQNGDTIYYVLINSVDPERWQINLPDGCIPRSHEHTSIGKIFDRLSSGMANVFEKIQRDIQLGGTDVEYKFNFGDTHMSLGKVKKKSTGPGKVTFDFSAQRSTMPMNEEEIRFFKGLLDGPMSEQVPVR